MPDPNNYNAASDLLESNLKAGRGNKAAFIDPVRELTYAQLDAEARRAAQLMMSLGLRREDRVVMIMLDTVDFPAVFLGGILAGIVMVPLNTALANDTYRFMLADSRAKALFVSAQLLPNLQPALADLPDLKSIVVVGDDVPAGMRSYAKGVAAQTGNFAAAATHPDEAGVLALFIRLDRHAQRCPARSHQPDGDRETLRAGRARHSRGRCLPFGRKAVFRLRAGQRAVVSDVRWRDDYSQSGSADAGPYVRVPEKISADTLLWRADLVCGDAGGSKAGGGAGSSRLRLCVSAGEALPEHIGQNWRARFGVDILDGVGSTELLHIFLSNRPGHVVYGTSGVAVPGYDLRLVDETGHDVTVGEIGELLVRAPSAADGYWNQREKVGARSKGNGRAPATNTRTMRMAVTLTAAVLTTCSKPADNGCRRSKSSRP